MKISVITCVLNNARFIQNSLKSFKSQNYKNKEQIIIDGGSKDDSLKKIQEYKDKDKDLLLFSSKDKGIYYAFNKGMILARGKYIGIINSDDIYTPKALEIISKSIKSSPDKDFIFGSVKKHWGVLHGYRPEKIRYSWGFYSSHSTGFFIKRDAAKKVGLYNTKYKYHADYDYFYRMIVKKKLKGFSTKKNELIGIFRRGGFSSKIQFRKQFKEELMIRYDNGQNLVLISLIAIYKILKNFKKLIK